MRPVLQKPYLIMLLSLIPGLQVWLFGKRRLALTIAGVVLLALLLFFTIPSWITWLIFGVLYSAQWVYNAYLSVRTLPKPDLTQLPDTNLPISFPDDLRRSKHLGQDIIKRMAKSLRLKDDLLTAILGVDLSANRLLYIGVTADDLIIAKSTTSGKPHSSTRIPRTEIGWVHLQIGEHNCLISFRYEEESRPTITLQIPGRLREEAVKIVHEFPGAYSRDNSFTRATDALTKLHWQPELIVIPFLILGLFLWSAVRQPGSILIRYLALILIPVLFFFMGWLLLIRLLRHFQKDPGVTSGNIFLTFFLAPGVLFSLGMSLGVAGAILLGLLE